MGKHFSKASCQALFFSPAPQGAWKGKEKGERKKTNKVRVGSMSGFTGSGGAMACRETGLGHYGLLKVFLLLRTGMGDGGMGGRKFTRRLGGHGGLEIMKRKASFTSLV